MARAGEAWSYTSPHTDVTQVVINAVHTSSSSHANTPHRVHTGDRQRHVQAALGGNTSREARQKRPGKIANEKWITARQSTTMRERQLVYFQDMPHCSRRRKTAVSCNVLRQTVTG